MAQMKFYNTLTPPTAQSAEGTYYVKDGENVTEYLVTSGKVIKKLSENDLVQLAGEFTLNSLFDKSGYITKGGAIKDSIGILSTGFVRYFGGEIQLSGYASTTTSILFFYDKYLQPISGYDAGTGSKNNLIISETDIPNGTYFIIAQARIADNNGKLIVTRKPEDYFTTLEEYIDETILLPEQLPNLISEPIFDDLGQPESIVYKNLDDKIVRTDTFIFSDTEIIEIRMFGERKKTFKTDLLTLKTTIS